MKIITPAAENTSAVLNITPSETALMLLIAVIIAAAGGLLVYLFTYSRDKKNRK